LARRTVLVCFALTCLAVAFADDPPAAQPDPQQLIAPLPDDLDLSEPFGAAWREEQMSRWVIWPSEGYIAARQPPRDRSEPVDEPDGRGQRKVHGGLLAPDGVPSEAVSWVTELLKPDWVPPDLEDRLILLQEDDAARSSVACRFEVEGTSVQVVQRRWAMCVVVKPSPALGDGVPAEQMGPALMRALFARGDAMAEVPATDRRDLAPGLWLGGYVPGEVTRWWHWKAWYHEGSTVAIYFSKFPLDRQYSFVRGAAWF